MKKILLVNGPNLNLLGEREPEFYGEKTLADLEAKITKAAHDLGFSLLCFQANSEGEIIDFLHQQKDAQGLIINPAAYTHYSYAIRDCIAGIAIPAVEVHISQIYQRETFRHQSVIAPVCLGQISGFGYDSYILALHGLVAFFERGENC